MSDLPLSAIAPSLPPSVERIVQQFQRIEDPKRRYEHLLWFAKRMKPFPETEKVAENKVPGCVSQVYIVATLEDNRVLFQADADSQITKGLAGVLVEGLQGLTPQEIVQLTPDFIQATGLSVSLTPSRANGFYNIFRTMQRKALELSANSQGSQN